MMKKIFIIIMFCFLITGCNGVEKEKQVSEKKDFLIEVKEFKNFGKNTIISKTGKIKSSQDITVSSNVVGRIKKIFVKQGNFVNKGETIALVEDNILNYGINLEKAKNGLEKSRINYDSTKIILDKQVFDAKLNLEKLKKNLEALKKDSSQNIKKAKTDLNNSKINSSDSKSALELQKIDNSIKKQELDYKIKIDSDNEKIESFYNTIKKEYNSLLIFLGDIIEFGDDIFGINKDEQNDKIDTFLGAKNISQKEESKKFLKDLMNYKNKEFEKINPYGIKTNTEILEALEIIDKGYSFSKKFLNSFETTFNNSISSEGTLSEKDISNFIKSINGFQTLMQQNYGIFLGFDTNCRSFLKTYKNNQNSMKKNLELLKQSREISLKSLKIGGEKAEIGYEKTIINTNDAINNLELKIKTAENDLKNALKSREVKLKSLQNIIKESQILYSQNLKEFNKLTIKSPISGYIGEIFIDVGEEISNGKKLFKITNNGENEITISFNKKELDLIGEKKEVFMFFEGEKIFGEIYGISKIADENLKYKAKVKFRDDFNLVGNIISVFIPIELKNSLIPINFIKINDSGSGTINILTSDNKIKHLNIKLGNIYQEKIEIKDFIPPETKIILSYIENYDEEKFILKVK